MPEMNDPKPGQMTDQGFIDNIVDRLRDLLPKEPFPGTPAQPPASPLPSWLTYMLGVVLTIVLSFVAAKWGVTPMPLPSLQSQPQIVVLQVPTGTCVTGTSDTNAKALSLSHPVRDRIRTRLIEAAVAKGATAEQAAEAVATLESERPLLDWLFKGGFLELLKLIMEIIAALK